jgi:hypothetical protein
MSLAAGAGNSAPLFRSPCCAAIQVRLAPADEGENGKADRLLLVDTVEMSLYLG